MEVWDDICLVGDVRALALLLSIPLKFSRSNLPRRLCCFRDLPPPLPLEFAGIILELTSKYTWLGRAACLHYTANRKAKTTGSKQIDTKPPSRYHVQVRSRRDTIHSHRALCQLQAGGNTIQAPQLHGRVKEKHHTGTRRKTRDSEGKGRAIASPGTGGSAGPVNHARRSND